MSTEFQLLVAKTLSRENHLSGSELDQVKKLETCCGDNYKPTQGQIDYLKSLATKDVEVEVHDESSEFIEKQVKFFGKKGTKKGKLEKVSKKLFSEES